jgi:MerR family transcriptional regulator/heat shock protein HspR
MSRTTIHQRELLTVSQDRATYSLETTAELAGVESEQLREYCRLGLLGPAHADVDAAVSFDESTLYEVRRIEHLRQAFGLNLQALPLMCELVREVERLRSEIRDLRD